MIKQTIIAAALVAVASGTAYAEDKQTAPAENTRALIASHYSG